MAQISISAIAEPVSIVHIPVDVAQAYATQLYWTINRAPVDSAAFFNLTSNRIEIAVFAAVDLIESEWGSPETGPVRVHSKWRVFHLGSGETELLASSNYDSPNIRHVSAPLAAAGISILYQSTYTGDFLLVKNSDFDRASSIFNRCGWHVSAETATASPIPRRLSSHRLSQPLLNLSLDAPEHAADSPSPEHEITVLNAALACVGLKEIDSRIAEKLRTLMVWPERVIDEIETEGVEYSSKPSPHRHRPFISYTRTEDDGVSIISEVRILRALLIDKDDPFDATGFRSELECETDGEDELDEDVFVSSPVRAPLAVEPTSPILGFFPSTAGAVPDRSSAATPTRATFRNSPTSPTTPTSESGTTTPRYKFDHPALKGFTPMQPMPQHTRTLSEGVSAAGGGGLADDARRRRNTDAVLPRPPPSDSGASLSSELGVGKRKRCLQLDLRGVAGGSVHMGRCLMSLHSAADLCAASIDRSGLVLQFSNVLESGQVRMLYNSTTHTANILVRARDVHLAKRLLSESAEGE
ncbi:uncharacterized protein LOC62_05G006852 [Vanrija pseudolonga]|uniref:CASTOR ACT domain-containing protein n=1 Tax=Vanrija pseudolonga TaxID=143232 RepID=A0AAF1BNM6_9TREE|nr:hypothetical protein LOC62_05G006852 [Vanrija pseudolonga]